MTTSGLAAQAQAGRRLHAQVPRHQARLLRTVREYLAGDCAREADQRRIAKEKGAAGGEPQSRQVGFSRAVTDRFMREVASPSRKARAVFPMRVARNVSQRHEYVGLNAALQLTMNILIPLPSYYRR